MFAKMVASKGKGMLHIPFPIAGQSSQSTPNQQPGIAGQSATPGPSGYVPPNSKKFQRKGKPLWKFTKRGQRLPPPPVADDDNQKEQGPDDPTDSEEDLDFYD